MPWWAWIWSGTLLLLSVAGTYDDLRGKKPLWYSVYGFVSGLLCVVFVASYFQQLRYTGPAPLFMVMVVASGSWFAYEAIADLRDIAKAGDDSPWVTVGSTLFVGVVFLSAIALGALHGIALLHGAG